jgi:selenide,water dikinase
MRPRGPIQTDIVLLGCGHAHLEVLRRFAKRPEPGVRLTLIAREPETLWSGMLAGVIRGDYAAGQAHIDLAPLAAAANARLIIGEATAIHLEARTVVVPGRPDTPFDLLSIDVGAAPGPPQDGGIAVRPIGQVLARLEALEQALNDHDRIVVVGGGPGGVELALALAARYRGRYRVALVSATAEPLIDAPEAAHRVAMAALVDASVEIVRGTMAGAFQDGRLALSDGSFLDAAACLRATEVEAPSFLAASGLACDAAGCVQVDRTLRSTSDASVFAAGDCAAIVGAPRPKGSLWAFRAGRHLGRSLRLASRHQPPRRWRPAREALVVLGLGHDRAVAWRNGLSVSGQLIWRWKDWTDRRRVRTFTATRVTHLASDPIRRAAKLGDPATGVVSGMKRWISQIGPDSLDGAAVLPMPPDQLLVQSADHLHAVLDDPYVFGQIAATQALSGLHVTGARPWTAVAFARLPRGSDTKNQADLSTMLAGATRTLAADGCVLVGGHYGEAEAASLGFTVSGLADAATLARKSPLRAGDKLILTKPLGCGVILVGHARGMVRTAWLSAAVASMRASNGVAAAVFRAHGVTACGVVSWLGVAGHLIEMLRPDRIAATIWPDMVPVLPGALELLARGVESTLAPENLRAVPNLSTEPRERILLDAQISGGLLAAVPEERAAACRDAMLAAGLAAAIIGQIEVPSADLPTIRFAYQTPDPRQHGPR